MEEGTNWASFYKDGFFGYGEEGDFTYFSIWHFLPIILLIVSIVLTYLFKDRIRRCKHEKIIRYVLATIMMLAELGYFWRLVYVGAANTTTHTLSGKFPLQVCEWTCIFATIMMFTESKTLFDIDVVICLTLGIAPLILPAVIRTTGPLYFRYYQYWLEHIVPVYSVFYMMFVKGYRYDIKKIYKPLIFITVLAGFCIWANASFPDAHYMYLQGNDLGQAITKILPESQFGRLAIFGPLAILLFAIEFFVIFFYRKIKAKRNKDDLKPQTI